MIVTQVIKPFVPVFIHLETKKPDAGEIGNG